MFTHATLHIGSNYITVWKIIKPNDFEPIIIWFCWFDSLWSTAQRVQWIDTDTATLEEDSHWRWPLFHCLIAPRNICIVTTLRFAKCAFFAFAWRNIIFFGGHQTRQPVHCPCLLKWAVQKYFDSMIWLFSHLL